MRNGKTASSHLAGNEKLTTSCIMGTMLDFIGVKIALINRGEILMIQRDDKPGLRYAGLWDFPGGGREGDETPMECILREIHEELGITLESDQIVWKKVFPAMHDKNFKAYFMVAEISENEINDIVFGNEGQGWKMFSIDEFFSSNKVVEPLKDRLQSYFDTKVQV